MRRVYPQNFEVSEDNEVTLPVESDEIIIAIKEEEIVFAVDALRARSAEVRERQRRAYRVEGEDIHGHRVDALGWQAEGYEEIAGELIFASDHSWKSSDNRHPEREAYEIAKARKDAFAAHVAASEESPVAPTSS